MLRLCLALLLLPIPAAADMAYWTFAWEGAGDWRLEGAMSYPEQESGLVTGADVSCFAIQGFAGEEEVGRWGLGDLTLDTTWRLTFAPGAGAFVVEGEGIRMPQAWNMDGYGTDCGPGGFGFNIGNAAQDLCLDGRLVTESQRPPQTPFPALRADAPIDFPEGACRAAPLLSLLAPAPRSALR
ncbi:hypothetical protein [Tropicimonas sp. IMCC34011]|uniref:hypothetical protein n=1 Tax=Tropicimonas sp. IMCC34011 TaxID=2248759 RepID=UPI000E283B2B|nr:hypothetical protein [Tropicimonas sp. IMCC34011]